MMEKVQANGPLSPINLSSLEFHLERFLESAPALSVGNYLIKNQTLPSSVEDEFFLEVQNICLRGRPFIQAIPANSSRKIETIPG